MKYSFILPNILEYDIIIIVIKLIDAYIFIILQVFFIRLNQRINILRML